MRWKKNAFFPVLTGMFIVGGATVSHEQQCPYQAQMPPPTGYTSANLVLDDQFTGPALDTSNWNPWMGDAVNDRWGYPLPFPYSSDGTTYQVNFYDPYPFGYGTSINGPHLITGAGLREIANPSSYFSGDGYSWASAAISSYNKVSLPAAGGYVQIRAKMPDSTHGAWAGLWFLSQSSVGAEIDLQESDLNIPNEPNANYTFATNWHGTGGTQIKTNVGVDLSAACHVYGMEYNPGNWLKMYFDGQLMATYTTDIPTEAYEIIIDLDIAGPNASGFHTVADATNHPGPFELDVPEVQLYSLP